ncbi:TPA: site-specific integrase [Candidatus Gastranaerophilales bacterium HUM_15]|nr:MAG TPA: site-specific integrase [Candidatus Gastranaerophilales bacterium HUM_15]
MEFVQPIRDKNKIEEVKSILRLSGTRDLLLFCLGINSALRVSDLLKLKVVDIRDKSHLEVREQKTGKLKRFPLRGKLQVLIEEYTLNKHDNDYLFQSRNGENKPISRVMAYMIINQACRKAGIQDHIGSHTLRKTFSYHHYQTFHDVAILQDLLNHSSPSITLKYIGITQDNIEETLQNFEL